MQNKYVLLVCLYFGYMMHTYSRRSFQNIINYVIKEKTLDTKQIGMIVSSQQTGYTLIKFVLPFIIDDIDPKLLFASTMLASFLFVEIFSYSKALSTLCSVYFLQGIVLGMSWPTLVQILKRITSSYDLGTWWSILCTSSNVATMGGAMVATIISNNYGWRNSMRFCAYVNLCVGILVGLGFIFFETPARKTRTSKSMMDIISEYTVSFREIFFNPILLSNGWFFFAINICRYLISDWYQVNLLSLNFSQLSISSFVSSLEMGGGLGSICAGFASDYFMIQLKSYKNPRLFILVICGFLSAFMLHVLVFNVTDKTDPLILGLFGFMYGFFLFGPIAVSGVISIEAVPPRNQGLSFSINSIYANIAMMLTGYPISVLASIIGWKHVMMFGYILLLVMTFCIILVRKKRTPVEEYYGGSEESEESDLPSFLFTMYSIDKHLTND